MAIPVELITMGVSAVWAGLQTYASKKAEYQEQLLTRTLKVNEAQLTNTEAARKMQGWHFTRRVIALATVGAVIVWPMFAPAFFPNIDITLGWTEMTNGFWPFTDPKQAMEWHTVQGGIVVTPLLTHTTSAIIGFFFGNQIAR